MQYVGQTGRALKKRFGEHYDRMNKPKRIDNFLYRHFKRKGHTPANILVQPVEKITYDANSTSCIVLLFYVHGKHLRSCRDGQLT